MIFLLAATSILAAQEISHSIPPQVIHTTQPAYTQEAIQAGAQGTVRLQFTVGSDGIPSDVRVAQRLGYGLDEKAVECLREWRFRPATFHGERVPAKASAEIRFRLPRNNSH